ncbi:MAG: hypothetical protein JNK45_15730 [Myxococcales bacterium]|jgi:hypothetical protein|nr:hypothetical protein [Myxococcales bacterium]
MRTSTRPLCTLLVLLTHAACGSDSPIESPTTTQSDDTGNGDSITEGVTLTNGGSAESSGDASADSSGPGTAETGSETATDPDSTGPGSTGDAESGSTDGGSSGAAESSSGESTGSDTGNTIYEVQDGTLPAGSDVIINGVVVTGVASNGVYVEEPAGGQYSAVFVFSVDGPDLSGAQIGDVVNLSGITGEYMSNTEIDITAGTYELVESGTPLDPDVVAIADLGADDTAEPWESVLIRIEGDFTVTTVAASNEFVVDDGGATARVDDFLYELPTAGDFAGFDVGAGFTAIQGPLNFFNNQFKIAGRDAADFEGYSAP